jgi:hypothetical protein
MAREDDMDLQFDQERNIVYIKLSGHLNREVILNAFDVVVADERYQKGMGRLWDFRDADLSGLSPSTIESMAKHSAKFPAGINDVKVAFVVGRELEFGLVKMFESFSLDVMTKIASFYSMEEAEAWMSR